MFQIAIRCRLCFANVCLQLVFEEAYAARDSATLEQMKELSSKRRVIEQSINESSSITEAIAREISGGLTSHIQLVKFCSFVCTLQTFFFLVFDIVPSFSMTLLMFYKLFSITARYMIKMHFGLIDIFGNQVSSILIAC